MKKYLFALSILTIFYFVGCKPTIEYSIKINPNRVNLFIGQQDTLTAIITPNAPTEHIAWESSNPQVVSVDANGVIIAKSEGEAIISAVAEVGVAQCVASVQSGILLLSQDSIECNVFETTQLKITKPDHKAHAKVTWKSSNPTIAEVNSQGYVTALSAGSAIITASVSGCKKAECNILVREVPLIYDRNHLIEHFTGDQCGYCPYGMYSIVDYLQKTTIPTIWVSHHAGFNQDEYTIMESLMLVSTLGVNGAPAMAMNRNKQETGLIFHPGYLPEINIADKKEAAMSVNIAHTYNTDSRKMDITISGEISYETNSKFLLTVLVKENRLVGKQADYYYAYGKAGWREYMHARVVRDVLTHALGDTIVIENQAYNKTYSYTIPNKWKPENCCIVAYVTPLNYKPIINAEQVPLVSGTTGGEQYYPYGITEGKGPNSKITFHQIQVNKIEDNNVLEVMLISNTKVSTEYGNAQPVGIVYIHTDADTLETGSYPIKLDNSLGSITAGYRIDEKTSFGGSLLIYAVSDQLTNGLLASAHLWRMLDGEMVVDNNGNITLNLKTCSGTSVSGSYTATSASKMPKVHKETTIKQDINLTKGNK